MPRIFPDATAENIVICVSGVGARIGFSALIANTLPCFDMVENDVTQCFPLYLYDEPAPATSDASLFATESTRTRRDAITDAGLNHFQTAYPDATLNKEDLFYYIYGLLHSPEYRTSYADNLSKELPRIPRVKTAADFWAFSNAGRQLAALHLNYETVAPYPLTIESSKPLTAADYRVTKMKYGKCGKEKDLTTVIYNEHLTLRDIPLAAYEYVVNGKPALDWVMERQSVKIDKDSGIVNDANDWAHETMNNPRYPLELLHARGHGEFRDAGDCKHITGVGNMSLTAKTQKEFHIVIERDTDGYLVASVPSLPGCHTQAKSLDILMERIQEAIELYLEVQAEAIEPLDFVGVQKITIAA